MAKTPSSIIQLRRKVMDASRRVGQPVIVRHLWTQEDVITGLAITCPACYDASYSQTRGDCAVCFGTGFVSANPEPTGTFFIDTRGQIVLGDPGTHVRAPNSGGFDVPYLTYIIQSDVAVDAMRREEAGILTKVYDGAALAPWYPTLGDNDICINIVLGPDGITILSTEDRFQLKLVQYVTVRGHGARPHYLAGQHQYLVQQGFAMTKLPLNHVFYKVPAELSWL